MAAGNGAGSNGIPADVIFDWNHQGNAISPPLRRVAYVDETLRDGQGGAEDDIGPGVIIASVAGATALLFLLMFSDGDDDNSSPPTGSN